MTRPPSSWKASRSRPASWPGARALSICAAPEIIYAEDTDGDGKADLRRTLFRGFATENYQARVNGLSYGLDNWVYGANGLIGGTIHGTASGRECQHRRPRLPVQARHRRVRAGLGPDAAGRVHDDWGNQFGGNNSVLIQHYPAPRPLCPPQSEGRGPGARRRTRRAMPTPRGSSPPAGPWLATTTPRAPTM